MSPATPPACPNPVLDRRVILVCGARYDQPDLVLLLPDAGGGCEVDCTAFQRNLCIRSIYSLSDWISPPAPGASPLARYKTTRTLTTLAT